jgi:hypothetical protein
MRGDAVPRRLGTGPAGAANLAGLVIRFFGDWRGIVRTVRADATAEIGMTFEIRLALRDSPGSRRGFV